MSAPIKLLLYIFFVVTIFIFVQQNFSLFDIQFDSDLTEEKNQSLEEGQDIEKGNNTLEVYNEDGNPVIVNVEVADTEVTRRIGLSGRKSLGDYSGMLFVMDKEEISGFWMKDMYISLDMIFIDSEGFIVDIKENLMPCNTNNCPNIYSNVAFKYVLEVNSGFVESNRVGIGNSVMFNISSMD